MTMMVVAAAKVSNVKVVTGSRRLSPRGVKTMWTNRRKTEGYFTWYGILASLK